MSNKTKKYTKEDLQLLIATTHRNSLDFLKLMFCQVSIADYQIIVVNQTTPKHIIKSNLDNVTIINSFEKGLSKSRNLAIEQATKPLCLLLDDDIALIKGFEKHIITAHNLNPEATVVSFQTLTTTGKPYWKYPKKTQKFNTHIRTNVLSPEITIKLEGIKKKRIEFDEYFGLGAIFSDGENYLFLKEVAYRGLQSYFYPANIVVHEPFSSSDEVDSDRLIYARTAMYYQLYKNKVYIWLLKYIVYLIRKQYIGMGESYTKWKVGIAAITKYKELKHTPSDYSANNNTRM